MGSTASNNITSSAPGSTLMQKFHPTIGRWWGLIGIALGVVFSVWLVVSDTTQTAFAVATGVLGFCWVMYVALVRPTMHAYDDHLLIRNLMRDIRVPWHLVEDVDVRQTTRVLAGGVVYHAVGIGRSFRQLASSDLSKRRDAGAGQAGMGGLQDMATRPTMQDPASVSIAYVDYVAERILRLGTEQRQVSRHWSKVVVAWGKPEIAVLVALLVAFVLLIVL
ncbi:MAG: hypothetical protein ACRDP1_01550 [Nocardioidaceae bacterium]